MKIAVIGAGALGLGFIVPFLREYTPHKISVYDTLATDLRVRLTSVPRRPDIQIERLIWDEHIYSVEPFELFSESISAGFTLRLYGPDIVITCVPPAALLRLRSVIATLLPETIVLCCENIWHPDELLRGDMESFPHCYPIIAWVSAYSQDGEYWCDEGYWSIPRIVSNIPLAGHVYDNYFAEYQRKLLLHNAMHAVHAYLGWADGCSSIPEAAQAPGRCYDLIWNALSEIFPHEVRMIQRERDRMCCDAFPDPIARVARTPSRKLYPRERLPTLYRTLSNHPDAQAIVSEAIDCAIEYGRRYDPTIALWLQDSSSAEFRRQYCMLDGGKLCGHS